MAEPRWTPDQLRAITENAPRLLVSAAAGSGKTSVLTERIIRRINDPIAPCSLSDILVVTFTKAATADLKEQIASAITKALAAEPHSTHLSRQLSLLPSANISTIHSFCSRLIRRYFQHLSLPASLRIADDNEGNLLAIEVMDQLLEDLYEEGDACVSVPGFSELIDQFVAIDDSDLGARFLSIYQKLLSVPNGIGMLDRTAEEYDRCIQTDFLSSAWGMVVIDELVDAMRYFYDVLKDAVRYLASDEIAAAKYADAFFNDEETAARILSLYEIKDYEGIASAVRNFKSIAIKGKSRQNPPLCVLDAVTAHGQMNDYLKKLNQSACFQTSEQTIPAAALSASLLRSMAALLTAFDHRFVQEKLRRGIMDYNDLERYTLKLLMDPDGKPSRIAKEVSMQYREIYIDEYQDVNEIQDMIFSSISTCCQRFMVGDIKQSIYAFRGSAPHLFARYRQDPAFHTVFLAQNFRSDLPIIKFSNAVFDFLFTHSGDEMPYKSADSLVCGKAPEAQKDIPCTLALIPKPSKGQESQEAPVLTEPQYVARCIQDLIQNKGYVPGDIVILLRSPSSHALSYEQALSEIGIDCLNKDKKSLLENEEVLLMLSLLKIIDNPRHDIDLAAVLRSPLYGMSMDDLVRIRTANEGCLFEALRLYTEQTGFKKGEYFLQKLKEYRHLSTATPVDRLIWQLMEDTGIASFRISDKNEGETAERSNLLMLYDYARSFESGSFQGLSNFLRYIAGVIDSKDGGKFRSPETVTDTVGTVRIMSIHASKGLQFPVCFVSGCGKSINQLDESGNLLLDRTLGIAMKLTDSTGFVHYDTPFRTACAKMIHQRTVCEEMRILYVALTRAKERLIVTGAVAKPEEYRLDCACMARHMQGGIRFPLFHKSPSYLRLILIALSASGFTDYRLECPAAIPLDGERTEAEAEAASEDRSEQKINELLRKIEQRYAFVYPDAALSGIPAKVTVSRLSPDMLDESDDSLDLSPAASGDYAVPRFLFSSQATGADRGTATHQFMQFCDFDRVGAGKTEDEISRLLALRFLPPAASELIDRPALDRFFASSLFYEMKNAASLRREVRFNTKLSAAFFTEDEAKKAALADAHVLVQGVIDCYFIDQAGRCVLIDYKTDRIPRDILGLPEQEDAFLAKRHLSQLRYYRMALEKMLARKVDTVLLWSFSLSRAIDLTLLCGGEPEESRQP